MCCGWFCKECKGWCLAFTKTERALTILETVLLVVLIGFLIFLILHLVACPTLKRYNFPEEADEIEEFDESEESSYEQTEIPGSTDVLINNKPTTDEHGKNKSTIDKNVKERSTTATIKTMDPALDCTWTPSAKTEALTHYYESDDNSTTKLAFPKGKGPYNKKATSTSKPKLQKKVDPNLEHNIDFIQDDQSDGENAGPLQNQFVLSLVKLKPPQGVIFGCILTIINKHWVLTSASCIEAIEEVDSLDSFVIMEDYGTTSKGKIHSISDLQIHPFYQGMNKSYDLAMIKSDSGLTNGQAVELPTILDHSIITIGERFHILGFGAYRSVEGGAGGRRLRAAPVYTLPARQCAGAERWTLRHLEAGRAVRGGGGGAPPLCAGVLYARGLPCNYCSGAPLVRGRLLLALMADNRQCGAACEPQLYVSLAAPALADWIGAVLDGR